MSSKTPILRDCIPKKSTQQEVFIKKYPEYDGRGIKIAIIDMGFDISMPSLQKTTTGLPKILDCFNFNKNGKLDTSAVRESDGNNVLLGLSGRKFKIPSTWKNPSGQWHLGCNRELFFLTEDLLVSLLIEYDVFVSKNCIKNNKKNSNVQNIIKNEDLNEGDVHLTEKTDQNVVPQYANVDCIVWFDGERWRACIATSEKEDLENAKVLTNYRDEHEFGFIKNQSYCVTIKEEGNLLEIFSSDSDHGTIVANVAAGYPPEEPHQNGLAPGAQIFLMNVSTSLSTIEKAIQKSIEMRVDIINLSMSLPVPPSIKTDIIKAVKNHGIIIFKGSPNNGPINSSIREDRSCICDLMFNIGSIIPHEIKCILNESFQETLPSLALFSAKGPHNTGERGIDFTAPGAIISDYPYRSEGKNGFYQGTSFATPNAAGSIACLLTALKANSIQFSPTILKLALSNTAYLPEGGDRLGFGDGIIQINSAFEYFKRFSKTFSTDFQISKLSLFTSKKQLLNLKGIFLIQKHSNNFSKKYCIKIGENKNDEILWILKITDGGEKFIEFSDVAVSGMFTVTVNSESLKPGSINFAEIHGFHSSNISFGPFFKFPITVILSKPVTKEENYIFQNEIILKPKNPYNIFLNSPCEYSRCTVRLTSLEKITEKIYFKYAVESGVIGEKEYQKFRPNENCKKFNIPSMLQNQLLEISVFQKSDFRSLKFHLEVIFQQVSASKVQKQNKKI